MTITAKAFLALEASLATRIFSVAQGMTQDTYDKIGEALRKSDFMQARVLANGISLGGLADKVAEYSTYCTTLAMLFGASRVTPDPGTSVVGMGFEKTMTAQAVQSLGIALGPQAEQALKDRALQLIALNELAASPVQKAEEDRILQSFGSFMDDAGKAYFNMLSSLHTSRVASYGFTAEAEAMGYDEYQINEQLDNRTCSVCNHMHGKVFKVRDAKALLDVALRAKNPEDLKHIQPWPPQDAESMVALRKMSAGELVSKGFHLPPFHPRCRGFLSRVGKTPTAEQITQGTADEQYTATGEDFKALGLKVNQTQLSQWNSFAGISPAELVARLRGDSLPDFLATIMQASSPSEAKSVSGITSFKVGPSVSVGITSEAYGLPKPVSQAITIYPGTSRVAVRTLSMDDSALPVEGTLAYLKGLVGVSRDMGMGTITLSAGKSMGNIESLQAGFLPTPTAWASLKKKLTTKYKSNPLWANAPETEKKATLALLTDSNPVGLREVAASASGKLLLAEYTWAASLDLTDTASMTLFLQATGSLQQ